MYQKIKQQNSRIAQKLHSGYVCRIEKEICKHLGRNKDHFQGQAQPQTPKQHIFGGAKSNRLPFWRLVVTDVTKAKKPFFTCQKAAAALLSYLLISSLVKADISSNDFSITITIQDIRLLFVLQALQGLYLPIDIWCMGLSWLFLTFGLF